MRKTPRGRISNEKGTMNAPTQSKGKKKKISLNTEKKKKKKEPDEGSTQKKRTLKCLSFDGLLGKLTVLKNVLCRNENIDTHLWIAALHRAKSQASEEHKVIALSSDSEHEKDGNLEADAGGALLATEEGAEETLPKNGVYDALWAMLDAESDNEAKEIPGQWDLDSVLNNWGKIELGMGPTGNDQGPLPAAN
ncbi:hypothetical protein PIB30_089126 [Stylosanthes scabra]|uniref:Uncharacterized protein n=1 Tax=Stylosanthes scabra TaxID=79078 RepID=A0ABU6RV98_9FABA|nr:hypothetical protein [Stylosanthes scabra]